MSFFEDLYDAITRAHKGRPYWEREGDEAMNTAQSNVVNYLKEHRDEFGSDDEMIQEVGKAAKKAAMDLVQENVLAHNSTIDKIKGLFR